MSENRRDGKRRTLSNEDLIRRILTTKFPGVPEAASYGLGDILETVLSKQGGTTKSRSTPEFFIEFAEYSAERARLEGLNRTALLTEWDKIYTTLTGKAPAFRPVTEDGGKYDGVEAFWHRGFVEGPRGTLISADLADYPKALGRKHRAVQFEVLTELFRGNVGPLHSYLLSDYPFLGTGVREMLALLLEEPNDMGKTLKFVKNKGYPGNTKTPMDLAAKGQRENEIYNVFRRLREGKTEDGVKRNHEDALYETGKICNAERTKVREAVASIRANRAAALKRFGIEDPNPEDF